VFILEIDFAPSHLSRSLTQVSDDTTSIEAHQEWGSAQDPSGKIMTPWTFDVKFPLGTQFAFGSMMFATGEDEELRMLPPGPGPQCCTPTDGQAPWSLTASSTLGGAYSGLDPFTGLYIHTVKIIWGIPVVTSTLRPLAGAPSSSSLVASPDQDSSDDYLEIGVSACGVSTEEGRLIFMVAPNEDSSHNSSSRYSTIGRS
jgi:hypothetical protein